MRTIYSASFLACILIANYVTTEYGMVSVGFGLTATAGTYVIGLTFVLRDAVQDTGRRRTVVKLIVIGALLSLLLAVTLFRADAQYLPPGVTPVSIALASAVAFLVSELADFAVYTPLRDSGYVRAALASNGVGIVLDTLLFLWLSGYGLSGHVVAGQLVGKALVTVAVVCVVLVVRLRRTAVLA